LAAVTGGARPGSGRFERFIAGLQPTPRERRGVIDSVARVASILYREFRPNEDVGDRRDYLIVGGHGKGTAIRPTDSVDMIYLLPQALHRTDVTFLGGDVAAALGEALGIVRVLPEGWFSVAADAHGLASRAQIRLVPCFSTDAGYAVAAPSGAERWINPGAEAAALRRADVISGGKATPLVLLLKAWRRTAGVPIPVFALEILACEFISVWSHALRESMLFDFMLRDFLVWLSSQAGRVLDAPGTDHTIDLGTDWLGHVLASRRAAERACLADRRGATAPPEWRQLFGPAFDDATAPAPWQVTADPDSDSAAISAL
jgi:hypothetical protein